MQLEGVIAKREWRVSKRNPTRLYRATRYIGLLLAILSLIHFMALVIVESRTGRTSPFIGSISFLAVPAVLGLGLMLVFIGGFLEHRHRYATTTRGGLLALPPLPRIDLNRRRYQYLLIACLGAVPIILMILGTSSFRGYEFLESTHFCAGMCHQTMRPQAVANYASPHAGVGCGSCHVGPGVSAFVRSKLLGVFEVAGELSDSYTRPIATHLNNLPLASNTCEGCHRSDRFYGDQLVTRPHYVSDEMNTDRTVSVVVDTGGVTLGGVSTGSHWHADAKNVIRYALSDDRPEAIAWVSSTGPDGRVTEYFSEDDPISEAVLARTDKRKMDCLDCHNRTGHTSMAPDQAIDSAIAGGEIDQRLPYIRKIALELVTRDYRSEREARQSIASGIADFYRMKYPALLSEQAEAIRLTTEGAQNIWARNVLPEMNVGWGTYPDSIGHRNSPGCFRCHDGNHISKEGLAIRQECELCHSLPVPETLLAGDLAAGSTIQPTLPASGPGKTPTPRR